jgi:bacterioferritin
LQRLFALRIGRTISQMLESDLAVEVEAVDRLRRGIEYMRGIGDVTSANIFEDILSDEEEHVDYLETQQGLISQLGEPLYLAQLVEQPDD